MPDGRSTWGPYSCDYVQVVAHAQARWTMLLCLSVLMACYVRSFLQAQDVGLNTWRKLISPLLCTDAPVGRRRRLQHALTHASAGPGRGSRRET